MRNNTYNILIVDDEKTAVNLIKGLLSKHDEYRLFEAYNAIDGLMMARKVKPDIIISDYYMPDKNGLEFCKDIRQDPELSNTIFILLTAETSIEKKVEGLETGVDDYIEKNISLKVLEGKIKAFLKIKSLQNELLAERERLRIANEQLEKNFKEIVYVLLKILEIIIPQAKMRSDNAKRIAQYISERLGIDENTRKKIIFGAQLHEIGKVGIPHNLMTVNPKALSQEELETYNQYPVIGSVIISSITGYEETADYIYHQLENFDGSGKPDGLIKDEIPIGAKILRAITIMDELTMENCSYEEAIETVRLSMNTKLDPVIATHFLNYLVENRCDRTREIMNIAIEDLKPGMIVAEDVFSATGVKIIPKDITLNERILNIILERHGVDPILGGIYIYKK
ncbi:MAG TPA: response regulator [Syntrophorhabdaceae bacterium]|nr:response regulator [Syntrophorhabdaceae bacterium]HPP06507.1 response regulator [Syntrophorhabdaceae bacterium]